VRTREDGEVFSGKIKGLSFGDARRRNQTAFTAYAMANWAVNGDGQGDAEGLTDDAARHALASSAD